MFGSRSPIEWAGREREREILGLCGKHMDSILSTVEGMRDTWHLFCDLKDEKVEEASEKVVKRERETDRIKSEIMDELSTGTFHPINREQIIRLILCADDVADNARAAARKIISIPPKILDSKFRKNLRGFSDDLVEITELMRSAFYNLQKDAKAAIDEGNKVERMEEELDSFRARELMPEIIKWSDGLGKPGTSLILKEATDNMEDVADRAENVADVIRSIAIGSL